MTKIICTYIYGIYIYIYILKICEVYIIITIIQYTTCIYDTKLITSISITIWLFSNRKHEINHIMHN